MPPLLPLYRLENVKVEQSRERLGCKETPDCLPARSWSSSRKRPMGRWVRLGRRGLERGRQGGGLLIRRVASHTVPARSRSVLYCRREEPAVWQQPPGRRQLSWRCDSHSKGRGLVVSLSGRDERRTVRKHEPLCPFVHSVSTLASRIMKVTTVRHSVTPLVHSFRIDIERLLGHSSNRFLFLISKQSEPNDSLTIVNVSNSWVRLG